MLVRRRITLSDFSVFHSLSQGKVYQNLEYKYLESKHMLPAHLLSPEREESMKPCSKSVKRSTEAIAASLRAMGPQYTPCQLLQGEQLLPSSGYLVQLV